METKKELAIICDLDGTLAIIEVYDPEKPCSKPARLRNPYDASNCHETDLINIPLAKILDSVDINATYEIKIIFVSGREDKYRESTLKFLNEKVSEYFEYVHLCPLFMRKTGDQRPDEIIKKEIYDENIKDKYDVLCVFDDRPKVIRMWRSLGLYVFDCGRGIEF